MTADNDTLDYDARELCSRISILTRSVMDFWADGGWSQGDAAVLLDKSMLHWQTSLASSLSRWANATSDGDLILAWTNLGALVEGQLKLFLCVYYHDYKNELKGIQRRKLRIDPDGSQLEELRQFFVKRIWDVGMNWNPYVELVQRLRNANVHAQFLLAVCYDEGEGVSKDSVEAVRWYRKAAERGDAQSQSHLGLCYGNGEGVSKDAAEAVKWYRKAAEQGEAEAQCNLGFCYANGEGVTKDPVAALNWFRKAADQGNAEAQLKLGIRYYTGDGVPKNETEAVKWYRRAADQGNAGAQLGYLPRRGNRGSHCPGGRFEMLLFSFACRKLIPNPFR